MDEPVDVISRILEVGTARRTLLAAAMGVTGLALNDVIAKRQKHRGKQRREASRQLRAESRPEAVVITTSRQGGAGTFIASGGISDAGTFAVESAHFSGSEASPIRIVHATEVYSGADGNFTLKRQIRITSTPDPEVRAVEGAWTVLGGTGAYADLHAQGKVTGEIQGTDPATELFLFDYTGKAHYD
jgi:hypothetical protein